MKMKLVYLAVCIIGTPVLSIRAQQNIQFTQYIFNTLSVNPAYAGYKEEWFGQMAMRSQWTGIKDAPQTGQLSVDGVADSLHKRMGLGLQVTADKLGPQTATSIYGNYAYRLRLDQFDTRRLSFGIGVGVTQYSLNGAMLDPVNPDDPALPVGSISNFVPDLRFGIYYYSPRWYVGASVMDLLAGDRSDELFRDGTTNRNLRRMRHVYLMGGALLDLSEDLRLRPSLLIKEDFKGPSSLDINALFGFGDKFWLGGGVRTGMTLWAKEYREGQQLSNRNSLSGIAQFYASDRLRIGYSYDYIISRLSSIQNGSHELTLGITFPYKKVRVKSPRFF